MKLFAIRVLGISMLMVNTFVAPMSEERREEGNEGEEERGETNQMQRGKVLGKVVGGIVGHLGEEERGDTNEMQRGKVLGKVVGGIVGHLGEEERGDTDYSWMDYIDLDVFCSYCTSPNWVVNSDKAKKNCRKYCAHGHEKRGQTEEMQRSWQPTGKILGNVLGGIVDNARGGEAEEERRHHHHHHHHHKHHHKHHPTYDCPPHCGPPPHFINGGGGEEERQYPHMMSGKRGEANMMQNGPGDEEKRHDGMNPMQMQEKEGEEERRNMMQNGERGYNPRLYPVYQLYPWEDHGW